jgi:DNA transposition AAA+ family ATPase
MTELPAAPAQPFVITKEYRRFVEFCEACRRDRYIGLCYGPPGVGKTLSARSYAHWDAIDQYAFRQREPALVPADLAACRTVFLTAPVVCSPRQLDDALRFAGHQLTQAVEDARARAAAPDDAPPRRMEGWMELLIIDEADRLKLIALETVRDRYDQGQIGLVLMGMPGIEKRMARYPQLYSRVGFVHHFRPLSEAEVRFILTHHWTQFGLTADTTDFTDAETLAAIIRITNGNFRLLQRLFAQIARVLTINQLQRVSREVVEAARESLVIGVM